MNGQLVLQKEYTTIPFHLERYTSLIEFLQARSTLMYGWTGGCRSNDSAIRGRTDGCYQVHYLPASLSNAIDNEKRRPMTI